MLKMDVALDFGFFQEVEEEHEVVHLPVGFLEEVIQEAEDEVHQVEEVEVDEVIHPAIGLLVTLEEVYDVIHQATGLTPTKGVPLTTPLVTPDWVVYLSLLRDWEDQVPLALFRSA